MMAILTPAQLWGNYDRFKPSEPTYLKYGDFTHRVYFNGESVDNQTVRIYARLSLPCNTDKKSPVLILLNGAGISVDETEVEPFLESGYAVLAVDYSSAQASGHYTRYPRSIQNQVTIESANTPAEDPKSSAWYHWTAVALHAVTFLENCEYVDSENIGIIGIDEGASIVFKASNFVKLKAGMTFFCGEPTGNMAEHLNYLASLDSRAYGKNTFPILINATTNEKNGGLDYLNGLYLTLADAYFSILPRADKSVSKAQRDNIKIWFDYYFGLDKCGLETIAKPQMNLSFSEGNIYAELNYEAQNVNFYAAADSQADLRNWNEAAYSKLGLNKYIAKIDVFSPKPALVFALVLTKEGLTLSTPVLSKTPQKLAEIKKSRLVYNSDMGIDVFMRENGGFFEDKSVEIKEGPLGLSGVFGNQITTYKPGESRFSAGPESLLQVIMFSDAPQEVAFKFVLKDSATEEFSCIKRLGGGEWSTITLSKNDFKCINGCPSFEKAVCLSISGNKIIVNSILWV